jgi:hypothetical protein
MKEEVRRIESLSDTPLPLGYVSGKSANRVIAVMNSSYIYLLTMADGDTWSLIGAFLDPIEAQKAKDQLAKQGVDPDILELDHAPIGIVSLQGIDSPYFEGPIH